MRNPLTPAYDWLTKAVGLDDRYHHGVSFTKVIIAVVTWCVCQYISVAPAITWPLVFLVLILVAAAMGRSEFGKVIDLLKAKWSGTSTDATSVAITGDASAMIKAAADAVKARRRVDEGFESSGTVPVAHHD